MNNPMNRAEFDIIVIGSGIAGLSYALTVAEGNPRLQVAIVTKKERPDSNTNYAQGGIAATLSPNDSAEMHIEDTLRAGCGLCREDVVAKIVRLGPRSVSKLIERGVSFTRSAAKSDSSQADLDLALEGGHSARRVAHAADLTGREIERALLEGIIACPNITVFENLIACDALRALDCHAPTIAGILAYDSSSAEFKELSCRLTIIATGGVGQVYAHTTNPVIATGDGLAMAFRAGATVSNLEFVQFHPTAFYEEVDHSFLISEAVRGEGGRLVNGAGHAFMLDYDSRGDLAPRDVVARAVDQELKKSGDKHVYLDLSDISSERILSRFPNIYLGCLDRGVDITKQAIPIVPAAHFMCGGIRSDMFGRTNIEGLMVCGEVAHTGMHGANRLASNSLLEAVVMADLAGQWTLENIAGVSAKREFITPEYAFTKYRDAAGTLLSHDRAAIKSLMTDYLGVVRSLELMSLALERVNMICETTESQFASLADPYGAIELRNMATVASLIIEMAYARHESRGLHYLSDYPLTDDERWKHDSVLTPPQSEPDKTHSAL